MPVEEHTASVKERIKIAFSKEHIVGTLSLLFRHYTTARVINASIKDKDWLRVSTAGMGLVTMTALLGSTREAAYPEADTFFERVRKAARHPDTHSVHAYAVYSFLPTLIAQSNHIYHGIKDPTVEYPRLFTGAFGFLALALLWKSMFSNKQAIGHKQDLPETEPPSNILQFIARDFEGLISRLLPLTMPASQLLEGIVKISHGKASGKDFRASAILSMTNDLVLIGYTYHQLWSGEKQKQGQKNSWEQKLIDNQEGKNHALSGKSR